VTGICRGNLPTRHLSDRKLGENCSSLQRLMPTVITAWWTGNSYVANKAVDISQTQDEHLAGGEGPQLELRGLSQSQRRRLR
jgi:hypothetical protein